MNLALNEQQTSTLRNALVVAAEKFDENAKMFEQIEAQGGTPFIALTACPGIIATFILQAAQTRLLIELVDGTEPLTELFNIDDLDPALHPRCLVFEVIPENHMAAIQMLRDAGYAVAVWSPEEIGNGDPCDLEGIVVERGNIYLESFN